MSEQPSAADDAPSRVSERPTWLVSRTYARSRQLLNDGFDASGTGLRSYHYRLLAALEERGATGQAELGRSIRMDRSDMVTMLGELETLGLVERAVNPENRRRNIVTITRKGRQQLRALDDVIDGIQEAFLAPLTPTEQQQFTKLLRKLLRAT